MERNINVDMERDVQARDSVTSLVACVSNMQ